MSNPKSCSAAFVIASQFTMGLVRLGRRCLFLSGWGELRTCDGYESRMSEQLTAPFPYFGGKSKVADLVWERFGDCPNYVEPFFGSGAVFLRRPHFPFSEEPIRRETVNDADGLVANFWRAVQAEPNSVAHFADWPVNEIDLHARGDWLFCHPEAREFVEQVRSDWKYFDAERAGVWASVLQSVMRHHISKFSIDEARADQLRCGGNGVVALQAAVAFVELFRRLMDERTN